MLRGWKTGALSKKVLPHMGARVGTPRHALFCVALGALFAVFLFDNGGIASAQERMSSMAPANLSTARETFGDWEVVCATFPSVDGSATEQVCELRHEFSSDDPNAPLMSIALQVADGGSDVTLSVIVPFGMLVTEPVSLVASDERLAELPFQTCLPRGCIAASAMNRSAAEKMAKSASGGLAMTTSSGISLDTPFSLMGFPDAWAFVQADAGATSTTGLAENTALPLRGKVVAELKDAPQADVTQIAERPVQKRTTLAPDRPFTQIGLFRVEANAQASLLRIQRAGAVGEIRESKSKGAKFWRVLIGPARDADENNQMLALGRSLGFKDAYNVRD